MHNCNDTHSVGVWKLDLRWVVCCLTAKYRCRAKLQHARNDTHKAAHNFRMILERLEADIIKGTAQWSALMFLAECAKIRELAAGSQLPVICKTPACLCARMRLLMHVNYAC